MVVQAIESNIIFTERKTVMHKKRMIEGLTFICLNGMWVLQSEEVCQKTYNDMKENGFIPLCHKSKKIAYVRSNEINNVCLSKSDLQDDMRHFWEQSGLTKEKWLVISTEIDNVKNMIGNGADKVLVGLAMERMSEVQLACYHTFFENPVRVTNYTSGVFEATRDKDKYRIVAVRTAKQFDIPVIFN